MNYWYRAIIEIAALWIIVGIIATIKLGRPSIFSAKQQRNNSNKETCNINSTPDICKGGCQVGTLIPKNICKSSCDDSGYSANNQNGDNGSPLHSEDTILETNHTVNVNKGEPCN
jgi:hypothetical protein